MTKKEAARIFLEIVSQISFTSEKSSVDQIAGLISEKICLDDIPSYASGLSTGRGSGTEGDVLYLPVDHMEEWYELPEEPEWRATFVLRFRSEEDIRCHISLPELVLISSIALNLYASCDGVNWNPWPAIEGMQSNCTRSAQLAMIPKEIRNHYGM